MTYRRWVTLGLALGAQTIACAKTRQFQAGVAAISGKGGTVAQYDAFPAVQQGVARIPAQARPVWQVPFPDDAIDVVQFVDSTHLLVGTAESGAYLGSASYKHFIMYDVATGKELWVAERPHLPRAVYQVLGTKPDIVIVGATAGKAELRAFAATDGSPRWAATVSGFAGMALSADRSTAFIFSHAKDAGVLEARSLATGQPLWTKSVPTRDSVATVSVAGNRVYVAASQLLAFGANDGAPLLTSVNAPDVSGMPALIVSGTEVIAWGEHDIASYDVSGRERWRVRASRALEERGGHKTVSLMDGRVVRVETAAIGNDVIETLDYATGKSLWRAPAAGVVVSAVVSDGNTAVYATPDDITATDLASGKQLFRRRMPYQFRDGSPTKAMGAGLPDRLFLLNGVAYVARELGGVAALSLDGGRMLWFAPPWVPDKDGVIDWYSAQRRYMNVSLSLTQSGGPPLSMAPALAAFTTASSDNPVSSAQRAADAWAVRWRAQVARQTQRDAAYTQNLLTSIQWQEGNYTNDASKMSRMDAAASLAISILGVDVAIARALDKAAKEGLIARWMMQLQSSVDMQARAFQGVYFARPISHGAGLGMTLVDIRTGRRADLPTAPFIGIVNNAGMDFGTVMVTPDGKRALIVGAGLDSTKFRPIVKWQWKFPGPQLLAFDIASLNFSNALVLDSAGAAVSDARRDSVLQSLAAAAATPTKARASTLWMSALDGDTTSARAALARGEKIDALTAGSTPIHVAVSQNHVTFVRWLIKEGADVNVRNVGGKRPLDLAKSDEMRKLLREAGAR